MSKQEKTYILSTGRCGTSYLYKFFNKNFPELKLTHQLPGSRLINIIGNLPLPLKTRANIIKFLFHLFNKNYLLNSTLDPLRSLSIFTIIKNDHRRKAKIIHLVRDPRDFVTSFMNWKSQSLSKSILHYLIPFWQPFPKGEGFNYFRWIFMSKFKKFCWVWYYKNTLFKQLQSNQDYKLVKMEDIIKNDKTITEILQFLELEDKTLDSQENLKVVNKSQKKSFPKYENWTEQQKKDFMNICGNLMTEFGYER